MKLLNLNKLFCGWNQLGPGHWQIFKNTAEELAAENKRLREILDTCGATYPVEYKSWKEYYERL